MKRLMNNFQANFSDWWVGYLLWNCPQMNVTGSYWSCQYWFRQLLGAIRQQATTCTNLDTDQCHHIASLSHNELTLQGSGTFGISHKIQVYTVWLHFVFVFLGCAISSSESKEYLTIFFNSLAPGRFEWNFRYIIFKLMLMIDGWGILVKLP